MVNFKKFLLVFLVLAMLLVTACSSFPMGSRNEGCTEGDHCRYYSGVRGVTTYVDRPPRTLYFRTTDIAKGPDVNYVDFNIAVKNEGASDSYGAVFFSGSGSELFQLTRTVFDGSMQVVQVPKNLQSCYMDFLGIATGGKLNFVASCYGVQTSHIGGRERYTFNQEFFQRVDQQFGWTNGLSSIFSSLSFERQDGDLTRFSFSNNYGYISYGRSLILLISSLDFEGFGGSSFALKGNNPAYPGGDTDYKTFRLQLLGPWPSGQDYYDLPYMIKSCYGYTTFVSPMMCIDPDPFSDENKVCRDNQYKYTGSQGAPVAVTSVRQTNTGQEMILDITIKNVGGGTVWDVGYLEHCSPYYPGTVRPSMKNVVYIGQAVIDNKPLDCGNFFKIRLDPNTQEARLTCRYNMDHTDYVGSAYTTPLKMELWYGYEENIRGQITIRKLN